MNGPTTTVERSLLRMRLVLVGPTMWGLHLLVAYLGGAAACDPPGGRSPGAGGVAGANVFILVVTAVAAAATAAALLVALARLRRPEPPDAPAGDVGARSPDRFVDSLAVGVNAFTLAAILLEGLWAAWGWC